MTPSLLAPNGALFLDVDGTLIEFVPRPEDARIPPPLLETLDRLLIRLDGALALVSGRALADVERLVAPRRFPAAGQHGAEARLSREGRAELFAPPPAALASVLAQAHHFLAAHPRIRVELKGVSAAVHYRGAEEFRDPLRAVLVGALAAHEDELQLLDSHLCFDLRPRSANKGIAIDRFMAVAPFKGRVPVFIGDDRTDEDGFAAVLALGGRTIRVGLSGESLAEERLANPAALRDWLALSAAALGAG